MNFGGKMRLKVFLLLSISILILLNSCSDSDSPQTPSDKKVKIIVLADPHFFLSTLHDDGPAFRAAALADRKMMAESPAIFDAALSAILAEKPDIVIIPGDLTKDGEELSHLAVAEKLSALVRAGIKVIVAPGNHDINNESACSYSGSNTTKINSVNDNRFAEIYSDFGFSSAIYRDASSLSYICEPAEGIWVASIDATRHNGEENWVGGTLKNSTQNWLFAKLAEGRAKGKIILGAMHHGIIEHFLGQSTLFADYLVDNFTELADTLARAGVGAVFTGHFHANDAVLYASNTGQNIYDIETGALCTWPCYYRVINLSLTGDMSCDSKQITSINYDTQGKTFQQYAKDFMLDGVVGQYGVELLKSRLGLSDEDAQTLAPVVTAGVVAHFAGDESLTDSATIAQLQAIKDNPRLHLYGLMVEQLWNDPAPADNSFSIKIQK